MDPYFINIVTAIKTTLSVSLCALLLGLMLGLGGAVLEKQSYKPIAYLSKVWQMLFRGLPEVFILFFIYYGSTILLTHLNGHYVNVNAFESGVIALGIVFGSYASQVFIAAFSAIPQGEKQAAVALGLTSKQCFFHVILPQIWRHAGPGLINLWLVLLKDSSIVSLIGLDDMMNQAHLVASESFKPMTFYLFTAGLYLLLTTCSQWLSKKITHHFSCVT